MVALFWGVGHDVHTVGADWPGGAILKVLEVSNIVCMLLLVLYNQYKLVLRCSCVQTYVLRFGEI